MGPGFSEGGAAEGVWIQDGGSERKMTETHYVKTNNFYPSSLIITIN